MGGALLAGSLVAGGCAAKKEPPPFLAPAVAVETTQYAGSALGGPTTQPIPTVPPDRALAVRVRFVALENPPTGGGQPLSAAARLIAADRLGTPVLSSIKLAKGARVVPLNDPADFGSAVLAPTGGRSADLFEGTAALAPGATAAFVLPDPAFPAAATAGGSGRAPRIELYVSRPAAGTVFPPAAAATTGPASGPATNPNLTPFELAVAVQEVAPLPREDDRADDAAKGPAAPGATPAPPPPPVRTATALQRETAVIDRQLDQRDVVCIVLPFRLPAGGAAAGGKAGADASPPTQAVAVLVDVARDAGSPAHLDAMSRAVESGRQSAERQRQAAAAAGGGNGRGPAGIAAAVDGLPTGGPAAGGAAAGGDLRASLVFLADQAGAHLCEDVALVADDGTLVALAAGMRAAVGTPPAPPGTAPAALPPPLDPVAAGWKLDKAAFDLLGQLVGKDRLPPELAGVLATHAGEAGRHPSSIDEVGRAAASRADFDARLVGENLIYLEDSSPSARVRAFDWLRGRNKAPAGYDPLGPPKERRAALDKAAAGPAVP